MDMILALLAFVNAFVLETGTLPTQADIAARFIETPNVGWWLAHVVRMGYMFEHMLSYELSVEGLDHLHKGDGTLKLVSGSMLITCPDEATRQQLNGYLIDHMPMNHKDGWQAGCNERMAYGATRQQIPAYFAQWFPAETAAEFRPVSLKTTYKGYSIVGKTDPDSYYSDVPNDLDNAAEIYYPDGVFMSWVSQPGKVGVSMKSAESVIEEYLNPHEPDTAVIRAAIWGDYID